jgi:hypothetical protein
MIYQFYYATNLNLPSNFGQQTAAKILTEGAKYATALMGVMVIVFVVKSFTRG